ncbi:hypothetical protein RRG08_037261 [Elysia crispata]|uniref:Uncharacterized protein n=1 Tax=Elysia crispata TaxID=231223 RepID=A0AAE1CNR8_9GAST|nr:hypothetical protein RRG08_037261 [Elysia crispata]
MPPAVCANEPISTLISPSKMLRWISSVFPSMAATTGHRALDACNQLAMCCVQSSNLEVIADTLTFVAILNNLERKRQLYDIPSSQPAVTSPETEAQISGLFVLDLESYESGTRIGILQITGNYPLRFNVCVHVVEKDTWSDTDSSLRITQWPAAVGLSCKPRPTLGFPAHFSPVLPNFPYHMWRWRSTAISRWRLIAELMPGIVGSHVLQELYLNSLSPFQVRTSSL